MLANMKGMLLTLIAIALATLTLDAQASVCPSTMQGETATLAMSHTEMPDGMDCHDMAPEPRTDADEDKRPGGAECCCAMVAAATPNLPSQNTLLVPMTATQWGSPASQIAVSAVPTTDPPPPRV